MPIYSQWKIIFVGNPHGYIISKVMDKSIGKHFNSPGHSFSNMKVTVIQQKEMIKKLNKEIFDNYKSGLNRKKRNFGWGGLSQSLLRDGFN